MSKLTGKDYRSGVGMSGKLITEEEYEERCRSLNLATAKNTLFVGINSKPATIKKKKTNPFEQYVQDKAEHLTDPDTVMKFVWDFLKWIFKNKVLRKEKKP